MATAKGTGSKGRAAEIARIVARKLATSFQKYTGTRQGKKQAVGPVLRFPDRHPAIEPGKPHLMKLQGFAVLMPDKGPNGERTVEKLAIEFDPHRAKSSATYTARERLVDHKLWGTPEPELVAVEVIVKFGRQQIPLKLDANHLQELSEKRAFVAGQHAATSQVEARQARKLAEREATSEVRQREQRASRKATRITSR